MNSIDRAAEWLLQQPERSIGENSINILAAILDDHAEEAQIDMRERCREAAYKTDPEYINVCWRIMDVKTRRAEER